MWETFLKHKALISIISLGFAAFLTALSWNIKIQVREEQKPLIEEVNQSFQIIKADMKTLKELSILQEEKLGQFSAELTRTTDYLNNTMRVEIQRNAELKADKTSLAEIKRELGQKVGVMYFWHVIDDINAQLDTFEIGTAVHESFHDTTHFQDYHMDKKSP